VGVPKPCFVPFAFFVSPALGAGLDAAHRDHLWHGDLIWLRLGRAEAFAGFVAAGLTRLQTMEVVFPKSCFVPFAFFVSPALGAGP
jgi:hypothetical protein